MAQLSDLTRTGYVKQKLARLYFNAGIRAPQQFATYKPKELRCHFEKYIEESGWEGQIPFLKDLGHNIEQAKKLKELLKFETMCNQIIS